jgi:sugar lactone lactonase YvrE
MPLRRFCVVLLCALGLVMAIASTAEAAVSPLRAFGRGVSPTVPGFANCTTSCLTGSSSPAEAGTFNSPNGMAFDAAGRLLVANTNLQRVDRFVADPTTGEWTFDRGFGWNVNATDGTTAFENCTAANCDAGTASDSAGGFRSPWSIAIDSQGRIYVAEESNRRVSRFTVNPSTGVVSFDRAFGFGVLDGSAAFQNCTSVCQRRNVLSGAAGAMYSPRGIALDSAGRIWVSDVSLYRVQIYISHPTTGVVSFAQGFGVGVQSGAAQFENCDSVTTCQSGVYASRALGGGFAFPSAIAFDPQGRLVVADYSSYRYTRFLAYGGSGNVQFDRTWGWGVSTGAAALETCTVSANCQVGTASAAAGASTPWGLAIDANGLIWATDYGNNRVVQFSIDGAGNAVWEQAFGAGVATGANAFETCTATCQAAVIWQGAGAVRNPSGVALNAQQEVFVGAQLLSRINSFVSQVAPGAPQSVAVAPGETTAAVTWAAPNPNGGPAVTAYTVTVTPGGATCATTPPTTTCTVTGLSPRTAYSFTVTATNSVGTGTGATTSATTTGTEPATTAAAAADSASANAAVSPTLTIRGVSTGGSLLSQRVRTSGPGVLRIRGVRTSLRTGAGVGAVVCSGTRRAASSATVTIECRLTPAARAALAQAPMRVRLITTFTAKDGSKVSKTSYAVLPQRSVPSPSTPSVVTG